MRQIGLGSHALSRPGTPGLQHKSALSFEELALPLLDSVYNFAHWLVRNPADAEDLVQETYLKAFRGFATFRWQGNFRAWMFQILKNTFLTARARTKGHETVPLSSEDESPKLPPSSNSAESLLFDKSRVDAMQKAIEELPVIFREVLLLCEVEEASYREIAEILSIPIGTVMSRLARARRAVRESVSSTSCTAFSDGPC